MPTIGKLEIIYPEQRSLFTGSARTDAKLKIPTYGRGHYRDKTFI